MSNLFRGCVGDTEKLNKEKNYDSDSGDYNDPSDIHKPINGSHFDLAFKRSDKVTYKAILPQVLACLSAASFHLPIGLVVAYSAILLDQLEKPDTEISITKTEATWVASLTVLIVPGAALLTGVLVDSIGRVSTLKAASIPYVAGWIMIASAPNITYIMVGRVLTGFALAMGSSPAAVYITEVARPDLRGALICLGPTMTSFGMVLVYLAGCFLHWRTVAWINIGFAILPVLLMYLFTPESPTWLDLLHQRRVKRLEREHERKSITPDPGVLSRFFSSIGKPTVYKPFFILSMCFFFQQFSGIYILIFYAVGFFKDVGSHIDPYLLSVIVGVERMCVGFITSQLLYRFGRRILCLTSLFFMAVLMSLSGGCALLVKEKVLEKNWLLVPIICLLLYICMSTLGLLSVPWTMTAEMYPLEVRGVMQGFTVCVAHILMFIAIKSYYWLSEFLGGSHGIQLFFAGVSIVGLIFIYVFLPETHRKSVEEIENYFVHNTVFIKKRRYHCDDQFPVKNEDDIIGAQNV
ncbi:facilitated trehalose transporter Tret1-2 homolog isoform X2 [Planococcus citri]|uniref:facilitated trehalose transporter Tret1-2 homolog isoform X2 n=1 Tax=Planococcus citri TaxID=170843 RepID=UPI0031F78116